VWSRDPVPDPPARDLDLAFDGLGEAADVALDGFAVRLAAHDRLSLGRK
jgi:hypothetical protein